MKPTLLLPIAGKAQRFIDAGKFLPKPLLMAGHKQIIDWAMSSINNISDYNIVFVVRLEHIYNFQLDEILKQKYPSCKIVVVDHVTQGSVETCLLAQEEIDNDYPLVIYTPDVYFEKAFDIRSIPSDSDGHTLTFLANSPAHSYVRTDENGFVIESREKELISNHANVGVYYFKTGRLFIKYAQELMNLNIRVKNEFYLAPIYNLLIRDNLKVTEHLVEKLHVLGTPDELKFFENNIIKSRYLPFAICADHSGFELKEKCRQLLDEFGINYIDYGCYTINHCDYPDFVKEAVRALNENKCSFGLGFCRTGQGVNICANKLLNGFAALVHDEYTAEHAIKHNAAKFFSIPSRNVTKNELSKILEIIMHNTFDGGRHLSRILKFYAQ